MYFEIYQTQASEKGRKQWRFRVKSNNHEIIASGEAYSSRAKVLAAIELIKSITARTKIVEG